MDEVNKRIIEFMVKSGHSKSSFAKELDVSLPLITHITSGRNKPGLDLIQRLLIRFPELRPDWLLNGLGDMYRAEPKQIDLSAPLGKLYHLQDALVKPQSTLRTVRDYHKILMDELLHLQDLDLQISNVEFDLNDMLNKLKEVKSSIESEVNS